MSSALSFLPSKHYIINQLINELMDPKHVIMMSESIRPLAPN